jgi:photosystem II stability/assembly factor-like uncharacterized protein
VKLLPVIITLCVRAAFAQAWVPQDSNTMVSLRGISAVSPAVAWAGGAKGTFLKTADGGMTWVPGVVPGAADADFRGVRAFSEKSAYLLSSGAGPLSRLYKTDDGGVRWDLVMINSAAKGFWDAVGMWDSLHGVLLGDPVNGRFVIWITSDGITWTEQKGPPALAGEGAFAASNSSLFLRGARDAWFGTGGPSGGRVFHSDDSGKTWTVVKTPVRHDSANAGIFSLAFTRGMHGVAVGGDYTKSEDAAGAIALTSDGGKSWSAPATPPAGYRSSVLHLDEAKMWIATGPSGSDFSADDGQTWKSFDTAAYNAMSFAGSAGWAVGPAGAIAQFRAH